MRKFLLLALLSLCLMLSNTHAAVMLVKDPSTGRLSGASGIVANGGRYDVSFVDGSCESLSLCDTSTVFTSYFDAFSVVTALLDQVFLDSPAGPFDSIPTSILGCDTTDVPCSILTVWGHDAQSAHLIAADNASDELQDGIYSFSFPRDANTLDRPSMIYAIWNRTGEIPEPATLALLILVFVFLAAPRWKSGFGDPGNMASECFGREMTIAPHC